MLVITILQSCNTVRVRVHVLVCCWPDETNEVKGQGVRNPLSLFG